MIIILIDITEKAKKCSHCSSKQKRQYGFKHVILIVVIMFALAIMFSGGDNTSSNNYSRIQNPTYKIDFTDGSSFYAKDFSRIDVKGSGGEGCLEFIAMTEYFSVNDKGEKKITKKGDTMFHCRTYEFSPPYVEGGY